MSKKINNMPAKIALLASISLTLLLFLVTAIDPLWNAIKELLVLQTLNFARLIIAISALGAGISMTWWLAKTEKIIYRILIGLCVAFVYYQAVILLYVLFVMAFAWSS